VTALLPPAPVFAALGDETRLRLVRRLSGAGPLSITQLSAGEAMTRQAITKHLEVLEGAGLLRDLRRGRERVWQLQPAQLRDARYWLDQISQQWDDVLDRLAAHVEDEPSEP
jgi:DNA-binding transcriptional ArsR family regulator